MRRCGWRYGVTPRLHRGCSGSGIEPAVINGADLRHASFECAAPDEGKDALDDGGIGAFGDHSIGVLVQFKHIAEYGVRLFVGDAELALVGLAGPEIG